MDYLMSVGLIKTATTIWIGWITIKNPTKYNIKDLSFIFFKIIDIYAAWAEYNTNIL